MLKYNKVFIALILAASFLMSGCYTAKNENKSIPEKMKDQDRQLD